MATLTTTEILQDTLDAFKTQLPMLSAWTTDFSNARSRKGENVIAHISSLPTVQSYDNTDGYKANTVNADSLLTDVTVPLDQLKHVPVKVSYLTQLASRKNLYQEAVRNYAYVLAKDIIDYVLGKVTDTNITYEKVEATANTTLDTLESIRTTLNNNGAAPVRRNGIVNSATAQALAADSRLASKDYFGQLNGDSAYRTFRNVAGFDSIWEYPSLPSNSINLAGFFTTPQAACIVSRVPDVQDAAEGAGVPSIANFETVQDRDTGLTFLGIGWQEAGTFHVYLTIACLYGAVAGTIGGAAGTILDKGAVKLVTS